MTFCKHLGLIFMLSTGISCTGPTHGAADADASVAEVQKPIQAVQTAPSRRVLFISCDGLRPDAIPAANAPVMQKLIETGSFHPAALAQVPSVTLPNHMSMVTGLAIWNHGVMFNWDVSGRTPHKTIMDVAEEAGLKVGFFINKKKLSYLCSEGSVEVWRHNGDVDGLTGEIVAAIADNDLNFIFIHYGEPDGAGHANGWMSEPYLAQVARVDAAIGRVLDELAKKGVREDTLIVLTADHGGHGKGHGLGIDEDRHIPFILNGPGIARGRRLTQEVNVMDAAATILDFLGLPKDFAKDSKVVFEAFEEYDQPEDDQAAVFGVPCGPVPVMMMAPAATLFLCRRRILRRRGGERRVRLRSL